VLEKRSFISKELTGGEIDPSNGLLETAGSAGEQSQEAPAKVAASQAAHGAQNSSSNQENISHDLTRKTEDPSLYKFYLDSVGSLLFTGWLVLAAGYIFSGKIL
jgi:hypothetical protein